MNVCVQSVKVISSVKHSEWSLRLKIQVKDGSSEQQRETVGVTFL